MGLYCLLYDKKERSKYLVLGPGAQKNISVIESYTTWIPFNVMSRTNTTTTALIPCYSATALTTYHTGT